MEQAAQELVAFVPSEPTMHKLLPWHELSPEQLSELYKQADDRGKATMIAGQIRTQCNLYVEGWTLTMFRRVLLVFGTLNPEEVDEDFLFDAPKPHPVPAEIAPLYWTAPEPEVIFKRLPLGNSQSNAYNFSNNVGVLVSSKWEQAFPTPTLNQLHREIQSIIEGFVELLQDTFKQVWESTFYRTLREAYRTPRCTLRELLKVLDGKLHMQLRSSGGLQGEPRKHYRSSKKRYFEDDMYQRDASPERMDHNKMF